MRLKNIEYSYVCVKYYPNSSPAVINRGNTPANKIKAL
nr:MAG TPA: hypothetical protein [Caudoviricetes sp.]